MKTNCILFLFSFAGITPGADLRAQADTLLFTPVSGYAYPVGASAYTARFDRLGRPFIYTANKEYGVVVFDFSSPQSLKPVRTFSTLDFHNLKPTDLYQQGNRLFVSLGDFAGLAPQRAGLAVLDVENPDNTSLLGQWDSTAFNKGSAAIRVDGDYAYLGAMDKGVVVLDVSDPAHPAYAGHVVPDLNWPVPPGLFSTPHARGLALKNKDLWVCYDAGGLRKVDVSDPKNPVESSQYINTALDAAAQPAYNTATIAGHYLFAAVDYCGLDVVDINNPDQPNTVAWENPWNCSNTSWDGSPGHTNQVTTAAHDSLLFLSGGDSEVLAYSIADPAQPRRIGQWAVLQDSAVTWGLDVNDSLVVLAQIWNPLNTPYIAKKGGIRLLRWSRTATTASLEADAAILDIACSPNPIREQVQVSYRLPAGAEVGWALFDARGQIVLTQAPVRQTAGEQVLSLHFNGLPAGVYGLLFRIDGRSFSKRIIRL